MKTTQQFKVGKNNISYLSSDFQEWFGSMTVGKGKVLTEKRVLSRPMNDAEIIKEFSPEEVSLGDILATLPTLDKDGWYVFYVEDKDGVLCAVDGYWDGGGWGVDANRTGGLYRWDDGPQVLSRKFLDTKSADPLNLSDLDALSKRVERLEKLFNPELLK